MEIARELAHALRTLRRRPLFTAVAVATLGLGIGATTAVFSVVHAVLLRSLPYAEPERLVALWERNSQRRIERHPTGPAVLLRWREQSRTLDGIAGWDDGAANVAGRGEPERLPVGNVTGNFFSTLGVQPAHGRLLQPADEAEGAAGVVVLSYGYFERRFAADPTVIGSSVLVDGAPATVVGVLPADFRGPAEAALWLPMGVTEADRNAPYRWFSALARLKPGVSLEQARADMRAVSLAIQREVPDITRDWEASLVPLEADLVGDVRGSLVLLLGAVGLVLLVACANVANLLLARALGRSKEIAVRAALGASRGRLVRLAIAESLVLALLGGVAGVVIATVGLKALSALLPARIGALAPDLSLPVLAFALGVSLATGLLFGLAPALSAKPGDLNRTLREGGRGSGQGSRHPLVRNALVVAEVALAVVLLVGAGLLARSFSALLATDPGFDPDGVLQAQLHLPDARYDDGRRIEFHRALLAGLEAQGGVRAAAASYLPVDGIHSVVVLWRSDRPGPESGPMPAADLQVITPGLFDVMGIARRAGRDFGAADDARGARVVVVNETMAKQFWPGEDAVGKRVTVQWRERFEAEVVGVVADVRLASLARPARLTLYVPFEQLPFSTMRVMLEGPRPASALAAALRSEVARLDPDVPLADVRSLEAVVADSLGQARFATALMALFAALALVLAGVGLYGVLAQLVEQRTAEFGVRMAIGAAPNDILALVLRRSLLLCGVGLAAGVLGAAALGRAMGSLLYGVGAIDPVSFALAPLALLVVSALAAGVPARRAAAVDPAVALRAA